MHSIISFKNQKDLPLAAGFYIFYVILFILFSGLVVSLSLGDIDGFLLGILGIFLSELVIKERKIGTRNIYIVSIVLSAVLFFFSPWLGVLVPTYLTMVSPSRKFKQRIGERFIPIYNKIFRRKIKHPLVINFPEAAQVFKHQDFKATDISDHLDILFFEALKQNPKLIVELGVRTGESTKIFEKMVKICGSALVQVDPDAKSYHSTLEKSFFVAEDDITFAPKFKKFCDERNIPSAIDLLFIDTTHLEEQTRNEIREWFPLLSPTAKVIFHDTNMAVLSKRKDGTFNQGWENQRGVIRPIEEFLGISVNEKKDFTAMAKGWLVTHYSTCSGFTIIQKLG